MKRASEKGARERAHRVVRQAGKDASSVVHAAQPAPAASKNVLVGEIGFDSMRLVEVGLNFDEAKAGPIVVNLLNLDAHFFLDAFMARDLGDALILASNAVSASFMGVSSRFCPSCRQMVRITTPPGAVLPQYTNHRDRDGVPCDLSWIVVALPEVAP